MPDLPTDLDDLLAAIRVGIDHAYTGVRPHASAQADQEVAGARDLAADYGLDLDDPFVAAAVVRTLAVVTQLSRNWMREHRAITILAALRQPTKQLASSFSLSLSAGHLLMAGTEALRRQGVDGG